MMANAPRIIALGLMALKVSADLSFTLGAFLPVALRLPNKAMLREIVIFNGYAGKGAPVTTTIEGQRKSPISTQQKQYKEQTIEKRSKNIKWRSD